MQHVSYDQLVRRAIRCQVCTHCHRRPKDSERLGPKEARVCEPTCAIFLHLPELNEIATRHLNEPGAYEEGIRDAICPTCALSNSAGEFCADRMARTCPLAAYGKQVIELIEGLLAVR